MGVARIVKRRAAVLEAAAEGGDDTAALGELGLTINRVARAARLSMGMEARVRDIRRARLLGLEAQRLQAAADRAEAEKKRAYARDGFIGRLVEETVKLGILRRAGLDAADLDDETIEYDEDDEQEIDDAVCAAERMLNHRKAYRGFADRPVSAVLAQVCTDLGLTPDWSLWADEDWAIEEAESVEGSVFAGLSP